MRQILDLHIHSRYSRACSKDLTLENIDNTCRRKGVNIITTGDFTHPAWFSSIENELEEINSSGLFKLKKAKDDKNKFILGTEVALIYKDGDKCRRIHICLHAPNIESARTLNDVLRKRGINLKSDGRPIFGMSAPELVKICLDIHPKFLIYPAHIWTPWFAVFGSKSGFDSMEECFHEQTENIFAYETGLSSDPEMNWRLSALDKLTLLSSSDAHSLPNIAREANVFDMDDVSYEEIYNIIKNKDLKKINKTIEFFPEEGMYHYDGHRDCNVFMPPQETKSKKGICPRCKKPITIGVSYRVDDLADRPLGYRPDNSYPYQKLVELDKIIAEVFGIKSRKSKKVQAEYNFLLDKFGPELFILMELDLNLLKNKTDPQIIEAIDRVRKGKVQVKPGFDGQYGQISIFSDKEKSVNSKQVKLI